jgi:cell division protein FtsL
MKRSSKIKRIVGIFILIFICGGFIITYVALKKKCDNLIKQKVIAEEELKNQNTKRNNLFAQYQNLVSEERIIPIAVDELGMIIADPPIRVITIDKKQMADLQNLLQEQYE